MDAEDVSTLRVSPEVGQTRVNGSAPLEAFGGGAARAQGAEAEAGIGMELSEMAGLHAYDANQLAQQEAMNKAMTGYNQLLYGSYNDDGSVAQRGLKQYAGKEALGASGDLEPQLKQNLDDIAQGFSDPRQKNDFLRHATDLTDRFHSEVLQHVDRQVSAYDTQSTTERVASLQMDAANNWRKAFQKGQPILDEDGKPSKYPDGSPMTQANPVESATHNIILAIQENARRQGQDPNGPLAKSQMLLEIGKMHAGVLTEMANAGDDQAASRYWNEHKAEIPPKAREGLDKVVMAAETVGQARRKYQDLINNPATAGDYDKQVTAAGDIENDKVRSKVLEDLRQDHFMEEKQKTQEQTSIYSRARDKFLKGGAVGPVQDPNVISTADWAKLTPTQQSQLGRLEVPPPIGKDAPVKSLRARKAFMALGADGMKNLSQPDFDKYWLKMTGPDRKYTQEVYQAAQQGQGATVDQAMQHNAAGDAVIANTGEKDPAQQAQLHDQLHQALNNYQTTNKKPAGPQEVQVISDQVAKNHLLTKPKAPVGIDSWLRGQNLKTGSQLWSMPVVGTGQELKDKINKVAPANATPEQKGRYLAKLLMEQEANPQ